MLDRMNRPSSIVVVVVRYLPGWLVVALSFAIVIVIVAFANIAAADANNDGKSRNKLPLPMEMICHFRRRW